MSIEETPIPHALFSVEDVADKEKFEVWRDSIACVFDVEADRKSRKERFHASVDAHLLDNVMLARTRSTEQDFDRTSYTIARDGMDHIMVQLLESGPTTCTHRHGETEVPESGLVIFDLSREALARTGDFTNLSIIIPRLLLEPLTNDIDHQHMRTLTEGEPIVRLLRDHLVDLKRLAPAMTNTQAHALVPATASLVAACLNGSAMDTPGGKEAVSSVQIKNIKRYIHHHLHQELAPDAIAFANGVSRSRLYELFKPLGGIAAYIREQRLRTALRSLIDTELSHRPIGAIALDCGFSSESVFSRLFKKRFGLTPREARQQGIGALELDNGGGFPLRIDRRYENWMQRLAT